MVVLGILTVKIEKENKTKTTQTLRDILDAKGFYPSEIIFVNKHLSIALNKSQTKIALVQNFNPNNPQYYNYLEIALSFIDKIERGITLKIHYIKKGEIKVLSIYPANNEIKNFFHKVFNLALIKKIETKYPQHKFTHFSASDWECSYVWAFSKYDCTFAYLKIGPKYLFGKVNLKKEHFTIDTKYDYFEAPVFGIAQQLFLYDKEFLSEIYEIILNTIKQKSGAIVEDSIYFDNYSEIIYLTNGQTSLQSAIIDKIDDVYYRDNRISFTIKNEKRMINYMANPKQTQDFEDFVTNYNLKKIAQNFDHKSDKLINTTPCTKFIIDFTRDRVVYCANLNKFASFSYMVISFSDLYDAKTEKSGMKHFVRIFTRDKEIIDVTCDKREVALYIEAQILKLSA